MKGPVFRRPAAALALAAALAMGVAGVATPAARAAAGPGASPDPSSVQSAYDAARAVNAERHQFDLVIETAKCNPMKVGGYACQIDFVRKAEPDRRLYFDVITIDEKEGHWVLLSGLCVKKTR